MMKNSSISNQIGALLLLALLATAIPQTGFAVVSLDIDRTRVVEGETVTLTFQTDDARQNLDADFSAMETDFHILDRRSETQLSIVNGRQTAAVRLLLTVEPKRAGELKIPAFKFGKESTEPAILKVDSAPELEPGTLPPVFIEVELVPGEGPWYVHAQFGLVVRVFYQLNLTEAAISQPEPAPASVRLLQETPYQAERGGERYRVLERNYAVFPERSGELVIPAMELTGRLVERRSSGVWQPQVRGRRVRAESDELRLQIAPRPDGFTGVEWQPARELGLSQQISQADALRVGEPVTRTVLIDAVGLEENMIVEPEWPGLAGARIYPDQPQGITRDDGRWVLGHKEFRYAVVPELEGELILPELKLDWWDTVNNVQRTAVVPAHSVFVQPSSLVPPAPEADVVQEAHPLGDSNPGSQAVATDGLWKTVALLFAALWLATLLAAWVLWTRRGVVDKDQGKADSNHRETAALKTLKKACNGNDSKAARSALRNWLREYGPDGEHSVLEFAASVDDVPLQDSIYALDAEGFRPGAENGWSGEDFWSRFKSWYKEKAREAGTNPVPLTDLYAKENRHS